MESSPPLVPGHETMIYSGQVIAEDVAYETWLTEQYANRTEWIFGKVIDMGLMDVIHMRIIRFLGYLFGTYLELTDGGEVIVDALAQRPSQDFPGRLPDVMVLLPHKLDLIHGSQVTGAADLIVEVVSPESQRRDRVEKFLEYERAGVPEYWILDPTRHEALFFTLNTEGAYILRSVEQGIYHSQILPRLSLEIELLWREQLPGILETVAMVQQQLSASE